ncbi:putative NPH3/RPT2-like family protein [Helianthus debilis subsp. tardiflorus]
MPSGDTGTTGNVVQRDGWVTIVRENHVMRVNMERLRARVVELEEEFNRMREEMKRVSRTQSSIESLWFLSRTFGKRKLLLDSSNVEEDVVASTAPLHHVGRLTGHDPRITPSNADVDRNFTNQKRREKFSM